MNTGLNNCKSNSKFCVVDADVERDGFNDPNELRGIQQMHALAFQWIGALLVTSKEGPKEEIVIR